MDIKQKKAGPEANGDPLIDGITGVKEFFERNGTTIWVSVAAVIIIFGGFFLYNNAKEANIKKAQEIFGIAVLDYNIGRYDGAFELFAQVANDYGSTALGSMSAFMAGSIRLQQNNVSEAIKWFEAAVAGKEAGFVRGQALEGLATAYEVNGDAAAAIEYLERALKDKNMAHRHAAIRWKLALLNTNNPVAADALCRELIADTLAAAYHQNAERLLAALNAAK